MLTVALLCGSSLGVVAQNLLKKQYSAKKLGGAFIFSSVSVLTACLFFVLSSGFNLNFSLEFLPYSICFALSYGTATVGSFMAIRTGSLSLTALIISYSLIIPTFFGLFFLEEEVSLLFWIGFALLMVSLFLTNSTREKIKFNAKWIAFVILAFLGNGLCSTVQTLQQRTFVGGYKNEFMIVALLMVVLLILPCALIFERRELLPAITKGGHLMASCGIANGAVNLFVILLISRMNSAVMFPILSASEIVLTWLISHFFYKEKLSSKQNAAMLLGVASVVLMNL